MTLILPYPPPTNRLWRKWRGRMVLSAEARKYKQRVSQREFRAWPPIDGPVAVYMRVYRPRKAGDLDGRIKIVLDALQGVAYANDSQVVTLHAELHDDKANPRVEVEVLAA